MNKALPIFFRNSKVWNKTGLLDVSCAAKSARNKNVVSVYCTRYWPFHDCQVSHSGNCHVRTYVSLSDFIGTADKSQAYSERRLIGFSMEQMYEVRVHIYLGDCIAVRFMADS